MQQRNHKNLCVDVLSGGQNFLCQIILCYLFLPAMLLLERQHPNCVLFEVCMPHSCTVDRSLHSCLS